MNCGSEGCGKFRDTIAELRPPRPPRIGTSSLHVRPAFGSAFLSRSRHRPMDRSKKVALAAGLTAVAVGGAIVVYQRRQKDAKRRARPASSSDSATGGSDDNKPWASAVRAPAPPGPAAVRGGCRVDPSRRPRLETVRGAPILFSLEREPSARPLSDHALSEHAHPHAPPIPLPSPPCRGTARTRPSRCCWRPCRASTLWRPTRG